MRAPGGAAVRSSSHAAKRTERKRSGLTGPRTAGQSRVVMAAVQAPVPHVSELARRSRRAGGREAGGRRSTVAAVRIQSDCAPIIKNPRSGQNLTAKKITTRLRDDAALRSTDDSDDAMCSRTNETRKWGVSDPLRTGRGPKKGAAKWGSLTPHLPLTAIAKAAWAATRAAQSAAR